MIKIVKCQLLKIIMQSTWTILIFYTVISNSFAFYTTNETIAQLVRQRRAVSCSEENIFKCKSGECIKSDMECDGIADCIDGSDETKHCRNLDCDDIFFRCAYGACVSKNSKCNNEQNCADNSDEKFCNSKCSPSQFQCKIGQCISEYSTCDGHEDCEDGSDEISDECKNIECEDIYFKCNYGACINKLAKCNGTIECADGSDESVSTCGFATQKPPVSSTRPPNNYDCILPAFPENGYYKKLDGSENLIPGSYFPQFKNIEYICMEGYMLIGNSIITCRNKNWTSNQPKCTRTCSKLSSSSLNITCIFNENRISCDNPVPDGTRATFECKNSYENPSFQYNTIFCQDGTWNANLIICLPVCGRQSKGTPLAVNAQIANSGQYPWHIALYKKFDSIYEYNCGGSIISEKLILTAAHCFPNRNYKHLYLVAAGKYYSRWDDKRDTLVQYSNISDIVVPDQYVGISNGFSADIAIVVLEHSFSFSNVIQPICLDVSDDNELSKINDGQIPGWGLTTEGGSLSDQLRFINSPIIPYKTCLNTVPNDFQSYVTTDKFCAGYTNGTSVCEGDSGGGFVSIHPKYNRFYIRGIVSAAPQKEESCDSRQYSTFTNIINYGKWIDQIRAKYIRFS